LNWLAVESVLRNRPVKIPIDEETLRIALRDYDKLSPDNMDVLGCAYAEVSPDPMARTLTYVIYTPIPKDLQSVFSSLTTENVRGTVVRFSPRQAWSGQHAPARCAAEPSSTTSAPPAA
jgi:hypothetical protein